MSSAGELARVVVDELVRLGVTDALLAPGSRNAPLSYALHAAHEAGRLRLHVRIDERSAAFCALGLAKASGRPVPVTCTSGTAAVELHPAIVEAAESGVPLVALTADRPPELRGTGANQTVDQVKLYGSAVRHYAELGTDDGTEAYWRNVVDRAVAAAVGALTADPGPVHLNLPLRAPLDPGRGPWGPAGPPWTAVQPRQVPPAPLDAEPARTLLVAGDLPIGCGALVRRWSEAAGWPLLAEPSSNARGGPNHISTHPLLLTVPGVLDALRPDRVLVVGRPTLSRPVQALLAERAHHVEVRTFSPRWPDAGRAARSVAWGLPEPPPGLRPDAGWLAAWRSTEAAARAAVDRALDEAEALSETRIARDLAAALPDGSVLVAGSSLPVRDLNLAGADLSGVRVLANRGAAGIDGTVSTAVGAALALDGPCYALLGDLTFLHDSNGLVIGGAEPRPSLCLVIVDNGGGSIFSLLEHAAPERAGAFERVFRTPPDVDLAALCAATRTAYTPVSEPAALAAALAPAPGLRVVHVRVEPGEAARTAERLRAALGRLSPPAPPG